MTRCGSSNIRHTGTSDEDLDAAMNGDESVVGKQDKYSVPAEIIKAQAAELRRS